MPPQRLALYIDYQNCYEGARNAFFDKIAPSVLGQFDPLKLGSLIAARLPQPRYAPQDPRTLIEVRVYIGRPDPRRQPKTHAAHMRQCARWEKAGIRVAPRMLRYPRDWPKTRAQQKGVDVGLAIDFIAGAMDNVYDVGVIASTDTDLKPPLEFVMRRFGSTKWAEVASWHSDLSRPRLSLADAPLWCHFLAKKDFDAVADPKDYNVVS
ncbi:MAG: NYN domain-containing protein [Planctomycetes bacterium]|nr:NYN domain-containing protein [Planctomycetota bacterium]